MGWIIFIKTDIYYKTNSKGKAEKKYLLHLKQTLLL